MKYVKEHINEVFTENSDPIQDLGIGGMNPTEKYLELLKPLMKEYSVWIWTLEGKKLKGKFRVKPDIAEKKYNLITGKIKGFSFYGKHFIQEIDKMMIIFTDEDGVEYYYYFFDAEKFYVE